MTDFVAVTGGEGLTGQYQQQSKFHIFKIGTMENAILLEDESLCWKVNENCMNFYSIKSNAENGDGGFHKLIAFFHQLHIYRKWDNLDYLCYGL